MNIVFAGTPEFAIPSLTALIESKAHNVVAVFTQPDRPSGRGRQLKPSAVKLTAKAHGIPIHQPQTLKDPETQALLKQYDADVMVVIAYGLLLPATVLKIFPLGCINVHASLLPRWRGAAPIQRAILAGERKTGVSIMLCEIGLDTGPVFTTASLTIEDHDTAMTLQKKLAQLGAKTLLTALPKIAAGELIAKPQHENLATLAPKIQKQEGQVQWQQSAVDIHRLIRAFNPWPVAFTHLQDETIRLWKSSVVDTTATTTAAPGTIVAIQKPGIDVATGDGIIRLHTLQFPGGKALDCAQLLNAKKHLLLPGVQFT